MIREIKDGGRLVWDEEDDRAVRRIVGQWAASRGSCAPVVSVLKRARKLGVELQGDLNDFLDAQIAMRARVKDVLALGSDYLLKPYPKHLTKELFAHQKRLLAFMTDFDAYLLADSPGVGKTAPAILWAANRAPRRVLVVTVGTARPQWIRAIDRWAPSAATVLVTGTIPEQKELIAMSHPMPTWTVAHWEAMVHARDAILDQPWDVVVLDESQAIKNRKAQRSETAHELAKNVGKRLCLSGHPYVKTPDELWSQLRFLYPDAYTSFWSFFSMHVEAAESYFGGMTVVGARQPKLLRWEIAPIAARRTKRQVFRSLPPIVRTAREVELSPTARKEYDRLRKEMFVELEGRDKQLPILNPLARTTRLRQFLVDPGILGSSSPPVKYHAVLELLDELDGPPVIFTSFREAAVRLREFLKTKRKVIRTGLIAGTTGSPKKRDADRAATQERFLRGELDALVVTTQAGGAALNLGKYGYVIFLDLPPTFKDLEQAEGRVDRPEENTGKLVPTTAWRIVTSGTHEAKDEQRIERGKLLFDEVFSREDAETIF